MEYEDLFKDVLETLDVGEIETTGRSPLQIYDELEKKLGERRLELEAKTSCKKKSSKRE